MLQAWYWGANLVQIAKLTTLLFNCKPFTKHVRLAVEDR